MIKVIILKHSKIFYFFGLLAIQSIYLTYLINKETISVFGTNDDALMALLVKKEITGSIETNIVFVKPLLSWVMAMLQTYFEEVYIYSLLLILLVILSLSIVYSIIFSQTKKIINKFLILVIFYIQTFTFLKWFFINPTYTGASIIIAFSFISIFLLINKYNIKSDMFNIVGLTFCMATTYLIREEAMLILIWFSIAILIVNYKQINKNIVLLIRCLYFFSIIIICNLAFENNLYSSNEWRSYLELNSARHKIQQRSVERNLEQKYLLVNWDRNDYILFTKFLATDKNKVNLDKLTQIIKNENNYQNLISVPEIKINLNLIAKNFKTWTWMIEIIIVVFIFNILFGRFHRIKENMNYLIIISIMSLIFIYILASLYQIPERISFNLLFGIFIVLNSISVPTLNLDNKIFKSFLILLLLFFTLKIQQKATIENDARQNYYLTMYKYFQNQVDFLNTQKNTIIVNSSILKIDWQSPYLYKKEHNPKYRDLILMSWLNFSPPWNSILEFNNLNPSNFWKSTIDSNLLLFSDPYSILIIENHLNSISSDEISISTTKNFSYDDLNLYKINYR